MKKISEGFSPEDEDDDVKDSAVSEPAKTTSDTKPKRRKKTKWEELQEDDDTFGSDALEDEKVSKPPWTGYNSQEGSIKIGKKRYKHGDKLPDGTIVNAPPLTWRQYANLFETFDYYKIQINPETHEEDLIQVVKPAVLTKKDCEFMDWCKQYKRLLVLAHRGFHKSVNLQRWAKICAADFGDQILYAGATNDEAVKFTQYIRDQFVNNENIKKFYGYLLDEKKGIKKHTMFWKAQREGESTRHPGLTTCSPEMHRTGAHPRRIFLDDVVGEEVYEHPILIKKINLWFKKQILPMCKPDTQIVIVGTFKDPGDLYNILADPRNKTFKVKTIRAIDIWPNMNQKKSGNYGEPGKWYYTVNKDGIVCGVAGLIGGQVGNDEYEPANWQLSNRIKYYLNDDPTQGIDPNRMSMQEFLLKRKETGSAVFETEYQLNPIMVTQGYLQLDKIKFFNLKDEGIPKFETLIGNMVAMFDQSFGFGNTADYNVISVISAVMNDSNTMWNYYIMGIYIWRGGGVNKKIDMVQAVKEKWPWIKKFGIEAGQINSGDLTQIQNGCPNITIIPVYQNKPAKTTDPNGVEIHQVQYELNDVSKLRQGKIRRILNQWDTKLEMGQVYWWRGIGEGSSEETEDIGTVELNPLSELEREKSFPKAEHVDLLDSCGSGFDLCETMNVETDFFFIHGSV